MHIHMVRADGVVIRHVYDADGEPCAFDLFLSWDDIDKIQSERQKLMETKARNKASRKPRP